MFYLRGHYPYAQDVPTLIRAGRAHGIGRQVAFPMVSNLSLGIEAMRDGRVVTDGALERVPYAFENRRLMHEIFLIPESKDQILPFWMIDPNRACAEQRVALLELADEFVCRGLKIQATIIQSPISGLLDRGRELLDLAAAWDVPLLIHTSVHPADPWSQNVDILRVVESVPEVRFILAHSCRFDRAALDRVAELPNAWFDCSAHRIACELAVDEYPAVAHGDARFPSDYRDPAKVLFDLASAYPGKLCWGSDAPFDSYVDESMSLRSDYAAEVGDLMALPEALRHEIANQNSLDVLKLKEVQA